MAGKVEIFYELGEGADLDALVEAETAEELAAAGAAGAGVVVEWVLSAEEILAAAAENEEGKS